MSGIRTASCGLSIGRQGRLGLSLSSPKSWARAAFEIMLYNKRDLKSF